MAAFIPVFLLTMLVLGLSILGLAMGSLMGRGAVQGSCGGISCGKRLACEGCSRRQTEEPSS